TRDGRPRALREASAPAGAERIAATGCSPGSAPSKPPPRGVVGYLIKPFRPPQVLAAAPGAPGNGTLRPRPADPSPPPAQSPHPSSKLEKNAATGGASGARVPARVGRRRRADQVLDDAYGRGTRR